MPPHHQDESDSDSDFELNRPNPAKYLRQPPKRIRPRIEQMISDISEEEAEIDQQQQGMEERAVAKYRQARAPKATFGNRGRGSSSSRGVRGGRGRGGFKTKRLAVSERAEQNYG